MFRVCLVSSVLLICTACSTLPASSGTSAVLDLDAQAMLDAHNAVRAADGVPPLQWSWELSAYAQQWAQHLAQQQHCKMLHRKELSQEREAYGENLFWVSALRWSDGQVEPAAMSASEVVRHWGPEEKQHYNRARNTCRVGQQCGHYTQLVWASTTHLGCAAALCPNQGQIWVCNYDPPGNWSGERPF